VSPAAPGPDVGPLSAQHPTIKHLRRLSGRRRSRREHGQYVIEGPGLVLEAIEAGVDLDVVLVVGDGPEVGELAVAAGAAGVPVGHLTDEVLARATDAATPQPAVAVANGRPAELQALLAARAGGTGALGPGCGLVLVLAGVADPGNAGALVRTAEATGVAAVVLAAGSVDPLGPKAVRAAAGSSFRVPLVEGPEAPALVSALRAAGFTALGTAARGGVAYTAADLTGDVAVVLGSEAHGLDPAAAAALDGALTIPMQGRVESLNVAVAGALVCFERVRQLHG
jgi:TrmH family RNA methyltransferase